LRGKDLFLTKQLRIPVRKFGSGYGAWTVGNTLLQPGGLAYCFGLGLEVSLEVALATELQLEVHGFDPTPRSLAWLSQQSPAPPFHVHPWAIGVEDGESTFNMPANPDHISMSAVRSSGMAGTFVAQVRTLESIHTELGNDRSIALLKMDIEGSEYGVLNALCDGKLRPTQIAVEFHHRFPEFGPQATRLAVSNLAKAGYAIADVSPNGEEVLFVHATSLAGSPS
jgi:FkbM family methyltransferase